MTRYAQYELAEKRGDLAQAEQELRRAAAIAPNEPGRATRFLARLGRYPESEQQFRSAEKLSSNQPKVMFERADTYIHGDRNLDIARDL